MQLIYVAGPYRPGNGRTVAENIDEARVLAVECWYKGYAAICPHLNTAHMEDTLTDVPIETWLDGTMEMLRRCDAILMTHNWQESEGAKAEHDYAIAAGIPVYYWASDLPAPAPFPCEIQRQSFLAELMKVYRLHISKNGDYSAANILGTGEIGLVTRLWDKIARLMNLSGFRVTVTESTYDKPKDPKHESIEDTLRDAAAYALIGLVLRQGKWGR